MHEFSVGTMEPGDLVENVAPEVVVVALTDDAIVFAKGELGAAVHGRAGKFLEDHGHLPFHENLIPGLGDGRNIHVELFAALGEAVAQGDEIFFAFHALDAVLKDDVVVIIRKDMRPIGLAFAIVGLRPKS